MKLRKFNEINSQFFKSRIDLKNFYDKLVEIDTLSADLKSLLSEFLKINKDILIDQEQFADDEDDLYFDVADFVIDRSYGHTSIAVKYYPSSEYYEEYTFEISSELYEEFIGFIENPEKYRLEKQVEKKAKKFNI